MKAMHGGADCAPGHRAEMRIARASSGALAGDLAALLSEKHQEAGRRATDDRVGGRFGHGDDFKCWAGTG